LHFAAQIFFGLFHIFSRLPVVVVPPGSSCGVDSYFIFFVFTLVVVGPLVAFSVVFAK